MAYVSQNGLHDSINKATTDLFTFAYKHVIKPDLVFNHTPDIAHDQMIRFCQITGKMPPLMWLCRTMLNYTDPILETTSPTRSACRPASTRTATWPPCSTMPVSASRRSAPPLHDPAPAIHAPGSTVCPNTIR